MALTFRHFTTNNTGAIQTSPSTDIATIIRDVSLEMTLGDERINQAGDLRLRTHALLPYEGDVGEQDWIAAYWDGTLFAVYMHDNNYNYDEKKNTYSYILQSIHSKFYADLKNQGLFYTLNSTLWNFAIAQGACVLDEIRLNGDLVNFGAPDRFAFSLGNMLGGLSGKHNQVYYTIKSILPVIKQFNDDDIVVIHRGDSKPYTDSISSAVDWTFKEDDNNESYNLTWWSLFNLALNALNAFIVVEPVIESNTLKVDVKFVTKNSLIYDSSNRTRDWIERQYISDKYRVDGYRITGENFEFESSYFGGVYSIERSVEINNTNEYVATDSSGNPLPVLCWVNADRLGTISTYQRYKTTSSVMSSGYSGAFYNSAVTGGNGHEGRYVYGGERLLDFILSPTELFPGVGAAVGLYKIVLDQDGIADCEGFIVAT